MLTENYRSRQEILDAAYKLIQNNNPDRLEVKLGINKRLGSAVPVASGEQRGPCVAHMHFSTLEEEVNGVISEIIKIKDSNSAATWDDFAILIRANSHADPFINALEKKGAPYEYISFAGLYRQPIVLDAINFFKVISDYHESSAIYRLLCAPFLALKENDAQKILHQAAKKSLSYYEALKRAAEFGISKEGLSTVEKLISLIHGGMKSVRLEKPTTILYQFLNDSGYLSYLTREEDQGNREVIRQIYQLKQFFDYISAFEATNPDVKVKDFLEHYGYVLESGDKGIMYRPKDTPDSVNILTVHSAKGLEFKYVFVVNLVEERFPAKSHGEGIEIPLELIKEQLPEGDGHYQEERRLFYVAITRAKERLFLSSADDYGNVRSKKISRFLAELDYSVSTKKEADLLLSPITVFSGDNKPGADGSAFVYELPKSFSFSQIKSYATCPYQYKLAHILKIPIKSSASFSFGQTIHATLQEFYQRVQELNRSEQISLFGVVESSPPTTKDKQVTVPSLEDLLAIYKKHWIEDWYKNSQQREEYFAKGQEILRVFYKQNENSWTVPCCLESGFKIKTANLVCGRIDRVDTLPDGTLEIIDYKTGKSKEKITGEDKEQLLIYQIALEQLPEYRHLGRPGKLTYLYLNDNIRSSFVGQEKDKEKILNKLQKTIDSIHTGNFSPKPSKHNCEHCGFKDICNYRE